MRDNILRAGAVTAMAAAATVVLPQAAFAVDRIPDDKCVTGQGFVEIYTPQAHNGILCFANGGSQDVNIYGVTGGVSGNNNVDVTYANGTQVHRDGWHNWDSPSGQDHITKIVISANTNNAHPVSPPAAQAAASPSFLTSMASQVSQWFSAIASWFH